MSKDEIKTEGKKMDGAKDVAEIQQKGGDPVQGALNKIKEQHAGEINKEIAIKVKAALDAKKAFNTIVGEIRALEKRKGVEDAEIAQFFKEIR